MINKELKDKLVKQFWKNKNILGLSDKIIIDIIDESFKYGIEFAKHENTGVKK